MRLKKIIFLSLFIFKSYANDSQFINKDELSLIVDPYWIPNTSSLENHSTYNVHNAGYEGTDLEYSPLNYKQQLLTIDLALKQVIEEKDSLKLSFIKFGWNAGMIEGPSSPFRTNDKSAVNEMTVNADISFDYEKGKLYNLNETYSVAVLKGIKNVHYEGLGGHLMKTNNIDVGGSVVVDFALLIKKSRSTYTIISVNIGQSLDWSEIEDLRTTTFVGVNNITSILDRFFTKFSFDYGVGERPTDLSTKRLKAEIEYNFFKLKIKKFNATIGTHIGIEHKINTYNKGTNTHQRIDVGLKVGF